MTQEELFLYRTKITGALPSEIGTLSKLKRLYLFDTKLEGSIPDSIGNLLNMEIIYLNYNYFKGSVPDSLCALRSRSLVDLWADCGGEETEIKCPCCTVCCEANSVCLDHIT
uniref:Uncharacterized protein n=1 Tax=Proboscia inermis TaxID=420281 RepID=A0A7S0GFU8_9STRA